MTRFAIPALILAPLAFAGVAIASSHGADKHGSPHGMHHGPPPIERIAEHLELDAAQTEALTALTDAFRASHEARREAHHSLRETAAAELRLDAPDFDKLATLAEAEAEEAHALHLDVIEAIAGFAVTLSPEQRVLLAEHLEQGPPHAMRGHHR